MRLRVIFQSYRGGQFYWWRKLFENHRPAASHWQTLSHNVIYNSNGVLTQSRPPRSLRWKRYGLKNNNYCPCPLRFPHAQSGVQHILCCVFVLFFFALCVLCYHFLMIFHLWLPLRGSLTFISKHSLLEY